MSPILHEMVCRKLQKMSRICGISISKTTRDGKGVCMRIMEKNHRKLWDEMKNGKDLGYEREVRSSKGGYSRYSIQVQIEG